LSYVPRHYQQEAIDSAISTFDSGERGTMMVMGTGTGKTVCFSHVADHYVRKGRILVLAHRDELIRQAAKKIFDVTGHFPEIEKGSEWANEGDVYGNSRIIVSSFQTQNSGRKEKRMYRFLPKEFSLLICDEFHHSMAVSYRAVIDYYMQGNPDLKLLGVTATPDRGDKRALGELVTSCCYRYELDQAVEDGYLVIPRQKAVIIEGLDFSKCRSTAGDLNAQDLEAAMIAEEPLHGVVHATIETACDLPKGTLAEIKDDHDRVKLLSILIGDKPIKRTLIFTVGIAHAEKTAEIINRWIPDSALYVCGTGGEMGMSMETRKDNLDRFSRGAETGEWPFLVNVEVCSEGWDEPSVELCVIAAPTKVRSRYAQKVGRVTRPMDSVAHLLGSLETKDERKAVIAASKKPYAIVLDFVGNAGRHKLVTVTDLLGGKYSQNVKDRVREMAECGEVVDIEEKLEQVEMEFEQEQQRAAERAKEIEQENERRQTADAARRASLVATTRYDMQEVDGFNIHDSHPKRVADSRKVDAVIAHPLTQHIPIGIRRVLAKNKVPADAMAKLTIPQAVKLKNDLIERHRLGLCTYSQASTLRRNHYSRDEVASMTKREASDAIGELKANGWKRLER
jgi:superfamily II DNA or RNA helicase